MKTEHISTLAFGCFRYAIGRQSYFVAQAAEALLEVWPAIHSGDQDLILAECRKALDRGVADTLVWPDFIRKAETISAAEAASAARAKGEGKADE